MKVVAKTDACLVLQDRPWFLAGIVWILGLAALYGGITGRGIDGWAERALVLALGVGVSAIAWWFFGFLTLTFDLRSGEIQQTFQRLGSTRQNRLALAATDRIATESDSDTRATTRLILETGSARIPLELGYSGGDRRTLADEINAWIGCARR